MAKKPTLTVTTPHGTFTRETASPYTHIVVRKSARVQAAHARGDTTGSWSKDHGFAVTWHMGEHNATAAAKRTYRWDRSAELVGVFPIDDELHGWIPEDDPDAWKARDAALISRAKNK